MLPKIVIHNSISLDGAFSGFEVNMGLHYQIAGSYKPDVHLIGSNTIKTGLEMYGGVPPEEREDFEKPKKDKKVPFWVIPDTKGVLKGLLHAFRKFEFCRDVIVLISKETPEEYIEYLKQRHYDFHVIGRKQIDLEKVLELLSEKYKVKKILTDTGKVLSNLLLNKGFANEISLLIHPIIIGKNPENLFGNVDKSIKLKMKKHEVLDKGYIWCVYKVLI